MANTEKGVVRNRSEILVKPLVTAQPVIVETNSAVPLTASQLNASALQVKVFELGGFERV